MTPLYEKECATIRELFKTHSKISQREFVRKYGLGTPTNLSQVLLGRRPLNAKIASFMSQELGIPVEQFSPRLAKEIASLQTGATVEMISEEELQRRRKKIPLVSAVHAGELTDTGDLVPDEYIETFGEHPDGCFALRVSGDSMTPVFDDGDFIVVDPTKRPRVGSYVVARSELSGISEATLKQYFEIDIDEQGREIFELRPLNTGYSSMHSVRHKLHIIGVVTELIKRFS